MLKKASIAEARARQAAQQEQLLADEAIAISAAARAEAGRDRGRDRRSVAANVTQGLQLSGDLTGIDVGALLRRLGGPANAGVADGVTHVAVVSADGDSPTKA